MDISKLIQYILFISGLFVASSSHRSKFKRQASNKCRENCILLRKCGRLLGKLRDEPWTALRMIKKYRCGRESLRVKVCCPHEKPFDKSFFPSSCGNNPAVAEKITFGEEAAMAEFPWAAALGYKTEQKDSALQFMCGGSVINARYILTAAHCLDQERLQAFTLSVIRLGDWNLATKEDCFESQFGKKCAPPYLDAQPEKIIKHPMFEHETTLGNDIALIRLDRTIDFTKSKDYIMPICLPSFGVNPELLIKGRKLIIIGWGERELEKESDILLKAMIPLANRSLCSRAYFNTFGNKQLCAGGTRLDSCRGDSGSPLMVTAHEGPPFLQVGIVSFGSLICGTPGVPAVYTSVTVYMEWIEDNLEPW